VKKGEYRKFPDEPPWWVYALLAIAAIALAWVLTSGR
jgi:hypothetical protein